MNGMPFPLLIKSGGGLPQPCNLATFATGTEQTLSKAVRSAVSEKQSLRSLSDEICFIFRERKNEPFLAVMQRQASPHTHEVIGKELPTQEDGD